MTSRIERLRALEKKWRAAGDAETKRADGDGLSDGEQGWHHGRGEQYDNCADELATLIAELGQEVGAVADAVGVLTVRRWRGIDAMVNHEFEYLGDLPDGTYSLFTSPAHTSEARDAVSVDVREMKTSLGRDYYVCVQVGDRYLTPNMYREKWKADFDAAEWTALFNGTARPDILSFMPEDAAMRQEGGE